MQASQVLSLFSGLVLAIEVYSLPTLSFTKEESQMDLRFSKRAGGSHAEEYQRLDSLPEHASYAANANSHLSTAVAHLVAAPTKVVTMPAAGIVNTSRNAVNWVRAVSDGKDDRIVRYGSAYNGLIHNPFSTVYHTAADPFIHTAKAVGHVGLAGKNYLKAAFTAGESQHTPEQVHQRHAKAWTGIYKDPLDHALKNAMVVERFDDDGHPLYKPRPSQ
jgi:hypothetical protein